MFVHADLSRGRTYLKFASWNIRILSDGSRTDTELAAICRVAKNFDLLVIQELRDEKIMQRMVAMLKKIMERLMLIKLAHLLEVE